MSPFCVTGLVCGKSFNPQVKDAELPLLLVAFTRLAKEICVQLLLNISIDEKLLHEVVVSCCSSLLL
jgi:hypothetical protein